ncbi:HNH endonuclease [Bacillus mycoides]|uniref:HNH endonuclease n=1 Tax=Bacillus mycoides TaxID=1405 RepID=UPI001F3B399E|nr:HNH endonuclease [Bacillus mycoides]
MDFERIYGDRGRDFIEAHHRKPISEMKNDETTKIEDLAMLCSNCHSMIHRKPLVTVEELRVLIQSKRNFNK